MYFGDDLTFNGTIFAVHLYTLYKYQRQQDLGKDLLLNTINTPSEQSTNTYIVTSCKYLVNIPEHTISISLSSWGRN